MKRWCCAALLLLSGCLMQDPFVRVAPAGEPISAPAWSLYTWKDQGLYRWALLPEHGPTPNLSRARAEARTGLPQLSERLQQLASGQEIFWNFDVAPISSHQFTLPHAAEQERPGP